MDASVDEIIEVALSQLLGGYVVRMTMRSIRVTEDSETGGTEDRRRVR